MRAARAAPPRFAGLTLDAWRVGKDLGDPEHHFTEAFGITDDGATLIRPDGFVAWNSACGAQDAAASLDAALWNSLYR